MPGNPLSIELPEPGVTIGPEYATKLRTALLALIDDIEAKITPDEITVNEDLSFRSSAVSYSAVDMKSLGLQTQSAVLASGSNGSLFNVNGELYYRDGSGNDIAVSSSGSLAAAPGNITSTGTPEFGDSGTELIWSGGDSQFQFKAGASAWADLVFGEAKFRNGTNAMTMSCPVTTDYELIWPAVASTDGDLASFDADGVITFGKDLIGDFTIDGDFDVSGDIGHGEVSIALNAAAGHGLSGAGAVVPLSLSGGIYEGWWESTDIGDEWICHLPLKVGDRLKSVKFLFEGVNSNTKTFVVQKVFYSTPSVTTVKSETSTLALNSTKTATVAGSGEVVSTNVSYYVRFRSLAAGDRLFGIEVTYDRPVL